MKIRFAKHCTKGLIRFGAFVLLALMVFWGCAAARGNHGQLRLSNEVNDLFESHEILEDHQYYYSGPDAQPNAIMGIHENYSLRSDLWKPVKLTTDRLKYWINRMTEYRGYAIRTYGSRIVGPSGERIGIWYSPWNQTVVKLLENNQVMVHTPDTFDPPPRPPGIIFGIDTER